MLGPFGPPPPPTTTTTGLPRGINNEPDRHTHTGLLGSGRLRGTPPGGVLGRRRKGSHRTSKSYLQENCKDFETAKLSIAQPGSRNRTSKFMKPISCEKSNHFRNCSLFPVLSIQLHEYQSASTNQSRHDQAAPFRITLTCPD